MKLPLSETLRSWLWPAVALLAIAIVWLTSDLWLPTVKGWFGTDTVADAGAGESDAESDHGHDHDETDALHLSEQARKNIGLKTGPVQVGPYARTITVPALAVEQPGRTRIEIAAPTTGIVTDVAVRRGETVRSGDVLFRLRLTHEDLIDTQTEFLRTLTQLDVARREIARLGEITRQGITAGEVVLERQYERDKLQAALDSTREALRLHGLSAEQVADVERSRRLIRDVTIRAPRLHADNSVHDEAESRYDSLQPLTRESGDPKQRYQTASIVQDPSTATAPDGQAARDDSDDHAREGDFVVQELAVHRGESVQAGDPLCVLADMSRLYVEGRAFEQDAQQLAEAARQGRTVTAVVERQTGQPELVEGLEIVYVSNEIDRETRALYFYVGLENATVRDVTSEDGRRYVTWRFKPGQRMQLRVPVETWADVIALPVDAVAQEGLESYVFAENGDHFDRRPVHVFYRDQSSVVIENDGSIFPGEKVALNAAHQLQMALKNKAGGGIDPHAGHNH